MSTTIDSGKVTLAQSDYEDVKKSKGIAYAFWFFLGVLGAHRFYVGDKGVGIAMLLTLGGLGFWTLADVFFIGRRVDALNSETKASVFARHGVPFSA
ncbi:MAG: TM2 domain-containing protein [Actinomycetes bacterium]